ncbi:DNA-directed RNA polymerase subunit alpha C-terminal domain-containing protein [Rhizobium sp.]|uniref:DNA-directed RNA polymerase subunit alpha C-terminal domain-containing protein n=1 Tax=Rhizobium sp. TaxID=391 RepID=UPI0039182962
MWLSEDDYFDYIDHSNLPFRLIQILKSNGLQRISQLNAMSDSEILLLRNIGPFSLDKIREHRR